MEIVPSLDTVEEDSKPVMLAPPVNAAESQSSFQSNSSSFDAKSQSPRQSPGPIRFVKSIVSKLGKAIEHILFDPGTTSEETVIRERSIPGGVMLEGCQTREEHFLRHDAVIATIQDLKGEEGLKAVGFEMRFVPCAKHCPLKSAPCSLKHQQSTPRTPRVASDAPDIDKMSVSEVDSSLVIGSNHASTSLPIRQCCEECLTRLFFNDTVIDEHNRRRFITDGKMYDEIARLCMEQAQNIMISDGDLRWEPIDEGIAALTSRCMDWSKPTLLFVTGKGKVRAGIFSRKHMLTTGMEPSSAIYVVRESKRRNMNIILLDPNCLGERQACKVIEKSMRTLFGHLNQGCDKTESPELNHGPLCFQVHSASGAHVVCCLMDNCDSCLPHIRAIAFTDSTHNIQWTRKEQYHALHNLLQSSSAVYFRSSKGDTTSPAGVEMDRYDEGWVHRFGRIRTLWAGTSEHSLSDWCARDFIWHHFDSHLKC